MNLQMFEFIEFLERDMIFVLPLDTQWKNICEEKEILDCESRGFSL